METPVSKAHPGSLRSCADLSPHRREGGGAAGRGRDARARGARGAGGGVGIGKDDPPESPGMPGPADRGDGPDPGDRGARSLGAAADGVPPQGHRVRLPGGLPHPHPHRRGERGAAPRLRPGPDHRHSAPAEALSRVGLGGQDPALSQRAVGRRAAAGGHRPRHRPPAGPAPGRRADREPRLGEREEDLRVVPGAGIEGRPLGAGGHPQPGAGGPDRPEDLSQGRADRPERARDEAIRRLRRGAPDRRRGVGVRRRERIQPALHFREGAAGPGGAPAAGHRAGAAGAGRGGRRRVQAVHRHRSERCAPAPPDGTAPGGEGAPRGACAPARRWWRS